MCDERALLFLRPLTTRYAHLCRVVWKEIETGTGITSHETDPRFREVVHSFNLNPLLQTLETSL